MRTWRQRPPAGAQLLICPFRPAHPLTPNGGRLHRLGILVPENRRGLACSRGQSFWRRSPAAALSAIVGLVECVEPRLPAQYRVLVRPPLSAYLPFADDSVYVLDGETRRFVYDAVISHYVSRPAPWPVSLGGTRIDRPSCNKDTVEERPMRRLPTQSKPKNNSLERRPIVFSFSNVLKLATAVNGHESRHHARLITSLYPKVVPMQQLSLPKARCIAAVVCH